MDILLLLALRVDLTRNIMHCSDTVNTVFFVALHNAIGFSKSQTGNSNNNKKCAL
jgi:hypothetical protein